MISKNFSLIALSLVVPLPLFPLRRLWSEIVADAHDRASYAGIPCQGEMYTPPFRFRVKAPGLTDEYTSGWWKALCPNLCNRKWYPPLI